MKGRLLFIISLFVLLVLGAASVGADMFQTNSTITRISLASDGTQGNDHSIIPSISGDGRYVAFRSRSNNLVSNDTNGMTDIFVYDRQTGVTTRVSLASDGTQGNGDSWGHAISSDGRYVAFGSEANNLVSNDTNDQKDIFVHDRQTGETTRVSIASDGTQGNGASSYIAPPSISGDGRYVAFDSEANNLVSNDTNSQQDVFVHDRQTGQTTRVSLASDGTQGNSVSLDASISNDGRYVAFISFANNLVSNDTNGETDTFLHDRQTGETIRVSVASNGSQGSRWSGSPSISDNGHYIAFRSKANNLVSNDTNETDDIFVHDRQTGETIRVSVASNGTQGNGIPYLPSISDDGRYVAFRSEANNLVSNDTNGVDDIFLHDRQTGETTRISLAWDGTQGNQDSSDPSLYESSENRSAITTSNEFDV